MPSRPSRSLLRERGGPLDLTEEYLKQASLGAITRALGVSDGVAIDIVTDDPQPGDGGFDTDDSGGGQLTGTGTGTGHGSRTRDTGTDTGHGHGHGHRHRHRHRAHHEGRPRAPTQIRRGHACPRDFQTVITLGPRCPHLRAAPFHLSSSVARHHRSALPERVHFGRTLGDSLARLKAHPLSAPHVPEFEALRSECDAVFTTENTIRDKLAEAEAAIDMRDEEIDDGADRLSAAILAITKNDREHPLYTLYFGDKPVCRFKCPVLGAELEAMRAWIPLLTNNKHPSLAALAPELEGSIKAADETLALAKELSQKLKELRSDGARLALVEKANATRKAVCGALAKLPHEQVGLPPDFASQFFRRRPGNENSPERAPTIEEVTARLAELAEETAEKEALLAELQAIAAKEAKAAAEAEAARAKLAELEMIMTNAAKEAAAVKAKLTTTTA